MQIVQRQDFSAYKTVGQTDSGKSGTIFKLQDPNNPSQFIAKKEFKNPGDFNSELSILQSVPENDFLVKPLGYDNDSIYYEFHEKGDLFSYINSNRLSPKEIRSIFRKIVAGVQFLHSHSIVHRDLKLENILMDSNCEPKLCDFGFSQKIPDYPIQLRLLGTASYIAPEVYQNIPIDAYKADIFSLGIILFAIITQRLPFAQALPTKSILYRKIQENKFDEYWNLFMNQARLTIRLSSSFKELFMQTVSTQPEQRPSLLELLESEYIEDE